MASPDKPLIRLGPFKAFDGTTAGPYADPQSGWGIPGSGTMNVDTERQVGAMVSPRGRQTLWSFTLVSGVIGAIARLGRITGADNNVVISTTSGNVARYNILSGTQGSIPSGHAFTQAVQFGNILYTNGGQQIRPASSYQGYWWSGPTQFGANISVGTGTAGSGALVSGVTYFYAFTTVFNYPDGGSQESNPNAYAFAPFLASATMGPAAGSGTTASGTISLTPGLPGWYGTASDGSTYFTNVYRLSSDQPTFYLADAVTSGSVSATTGVFIDGVADSTIANNTQLQYRFPLPQTLALIEGGTNYAPIFRHKERMFVFTMFADPTLTDSIAQCQLWYSDSGLPASFFADTQVLLVGDDSDNVNATNAIVNYSLLTNDQPQAGVSLSSVGILHKRRSLWILYGDDPSTFLPRKMAGPGAGTLSSGSVTVCGGNGDVDAWLADEGPYLTDGNSLTYIGEPVREYLEMIPQSDQIASVGFYANRTWYLSFPATSVTLRYYFPKGKWLPPLPYATQAAYALTSESSQPITNPPREEIVAAAPGQVGVNYWMYQDGSDLNSPIASTWESPLTDCGEPGMVKMFEQVVVNAPIQSSGASIKVILTIDQNLSKQFTWEFDLSQGPSFVASVPNGPAQPNIPGSVAQDNTGYMAQVIVSMTTQNALGNVPIVLYSVEVHGSPMRHLVDSTSGVSA